jgi:hypothetical protein
LQARASSSDYEKLIEEEFFPFWDEETKTAWRKGLEMFVDLCGSPPEADFMEHELLCLLMVESGLAVKHVLSGKDIELFRQTGGLVQKALSSGYDYFIATPGIFREILSALASAVREGGEA